MLYAIIIGFVCLVIVGIKYDQIVPPIQKVLSNSHKNHITKRFHELHLNYKLLILLVLFSIMFVGYSIILLIIGIPRIEQLIEIRSKNISQLNERKFTRKFGEYSYIGFRADDGTYLQYKSAYPGYSKVKESLKNDNNFSFLIKSREGSDSLFQISTNGIKVVAYEDIREYHVRLAWFNIALNIMFILGGSFFISMNRKCSKK